MASRRSRKSQATRVEASDSGDEQQSSQEADILKTAQNIVENNKNRREIKRKAIEADHDKRIKETRAKIDKHFEARKSRVTKAQNASWDKIDALNKKRQNLEQLILASMKMVEIHTTNLCSEMNAMLEGRIEEVEQRSTEGA